MKNAIIARSQDLFSIWVAMQSRDPLLLRFLFLSMNEHKNLTLFFYANDKQSCYQIWTNRKKIQKK